MFVHTRSSAPKRFAKFLSQKSGKSDCQTRVRQTIEFELRVRFEGLGLG